MKYGCIGEHLRHSFSKEVHNALADYEYEIKEIPSAELDAFMVNRNFLAINVTIPYKEKVIPHMRSIDEYASAIGAVNTVVNRGGELYGYNTDFYGMRMLAYHAGISMEHRKVAVLGTGGTSKTAYAVAKSLGADQIVRVSRTAREGSIDYRELYEKHCDTEIIINTTPVGMFPEIYECPVDLSRFPTLVGVLDAVYNPIRTPLILAAKERGVAAEGGLYMLISQAVRASEIFIDTVYPKEAVERVYEKILREKENIVLTGMPASGKSTVGKLLSKSTGREFIDTDALIVERAKMPISDIFEKFGEKYFRDLETDIIKEVSKRNGVIISTGGGAVLRGENVAALKENGKMFFIDRPLPSLMPTDDRPLASTKEHIKRLYNERYAIYTSTSDEVIYADCPADAVAQKIRGSFGI